MFSTWYISTSCGEFLCCWFSLLLHLIESSYYLDNFLQMKLTWPVNITRTQGTACSISVYSAFFATSRRQISCRWQTHQRNEQCHFMEIFLQPITTGTDFKKISTIYFFYLNRPVGSTYSRSDFSSDHDAIPENCLRLYNKRVHVYSCQFDFHVLLFRIFWINMKQQIFKQFKTMLGFGVADLVLWVNRLSVFGIAYCFLETWMLFVNFNLYSELCSNDTCISHTCLLNAFETNND